MVNLGSYERAVKSLWSGKCTVSIKKYETNEKNGRSEAKEVKILEDEPCRVSYKTIEPTKMANAATRRQEIILFIGKNTDIPEGSRLTVTQNGTTEVYAQSGTPAVYSIHKEIPLELFRGWA